MQYTRTNDSIQYSTTNDTMLYNAMQFNQWYNAIQYNQWYNVIQSNTVQQTIQCYTHATQFNQWYNVNDTMLYNAIQYNQCYTIPCWPLKRGTWRKNQILLSDPFVSRNFHDWCIVYWWQQMNDIDVNKCSEQWAWDAIWSTSGAEFSTIFRLLENNFAWNIKRIYFMKDLGVRCCPDRPNVVHLL